MTEYTTGQTVPESGLYKYTGHRTEHKGCTPTEEEQVIPMARGGTFPPLKSCKSEAKWTLFKRG